MFWKHQTPSLQKGGVWCFWGWPRLFCAVKPAPAKTLWWDAVARKIFTGHLFFVRAQSVKLPVVI